MIHRCDQCPHYRPPVPPDGPTPCRVLFIGEAPSYDEDKRGAPFVGRTGRELNQQYLGLVGLPRQEVRITNARLCSERTYDNPTVAQAKCCSALHLPAELELCRPEIVVPMGAVACGVLGVDLDACHGVPQPWSWGGHHFTVYPTHHPAAGIHESRFMIPLQQDFAGLREVLDGIRVPPVDSHPAPDYQLVKSTAQIDADFDPTPAWVGVDTEWDESSEDKTPHCLSYSTRPGMGRVILASIPELVQYFAWRLLTGPDLRSSGSRVVFHNALADLEILIRMGVYIPPNWWDTMEAAYQLALPQSLKTLAFRYHGMHMQDYDDLVKPHWVQAAVSWLGELVSMSDDPVVEPIGGRRKGYVLRLQRGDLYQVESAAKGPYVRSFKTPQTAIECGWRLRSPVFREASRVLNLILEKGSAPTLWGNVDDVLQSEGSFLVGANYPQKSITAVPPEQLVPYSAADADATLRLRPTMKELLRKVR